MRHLHQRSAEFTHSEFVDFIWSADKQQLFPLLVVPLMETVCVICEVRTEPSDKG
jgi:hypothetical protein